MPRREVIKVLRPNPPKSVHNAVSFADVYDTLGETYGPNAPGLGRGADEIAWHWDRFLLTDDNGDRILAIAGDLAPPKSLAQTAWGFVLEVDASIAEGGAIFQRVEPHTALDPISIGRPWSVDRLQLAHKVDSVVATNANMIEVIIDLEAVAPPITEPAFLEAEADLLGSGLWPESVTNMYLLGRHILNQL